MNTGLQGGEHKSRSDSIIKGAVSAVRFCCQAFVSGAIKGHRGSGQVDAHGTVIHPITWSIKTNCSI